MVAIVGVLDGSLLRNNANLPDENNQSSANNAKQTAHWYEEENGAGIQGITVVDEFRNNVDIPQIVWLNEAIKYRLNIENRLYTLVHDNDSGIDTNATPGALFEKITVRGQYRSILNQYWTIGSDPVTYRIQL
jgi:hypothetical protein